MLKPSSSVASNKRLFLEPSNSFVNSVSSSILSNVPLVVSNWVSDSLSCSTISSLSALGIGWLSILIIPAVVCFAIVLFCWVWLWSLGAGGAVSPIFLVSLASLFLKPLLIRNASDSPSSSARIALSILLPIIGILVRPTLAASFKGFNSFFKSLNANFNLVDNPSTSPSLLLVSPTVALIYSISSGSNWPVFIVSSIFLSVDFCNCKASSYSIPLILSRSAIV